MFLGFGGFGSEVVGLGFGFVFRGNEIWVFGFGFKVGLGVWVKLGAFGFRVFGFFFVFS